MTNDQVHEGIIGKVDAVFSGVRRSVDTAISAIERCDAKTDAAINHLIASRRTLLWILVFVLMDFLFGVYAGLKL